MVSPEDQVITTHIYLLTIPAIVCQGNANITNSRFDRNSGYTNGSTICSDGNVTLRGCSLWDNSMLNTGSYGNVYARNIFAVNSTFIGNSGGRGGTVLGEVSFRCDADMT